MYRAHSTVKRERLLAKLRAKGVPEKFVSIFNAWLQDRKGNVVVGGQQSDPMRLRDMITKGQFGGHGFETFLMKMIGWLCMLRHSWKSCSLTI